MAGPPQPSPEWLKNRPDRLRSEGEEKQNDSLFVRGESPSVFKGFSRRSPHMPPSRSVDFAALVSKFSGGAIGSATSIVSGVKRPHKADSERSASGVRHGWPRVDSNTASESSSCLSGSDEALSTTQLALRTGGSAGVVAGSGRLSSRSQGQAELGSGVGVGKESPSSNEARSPPTAKRCAMVNALVHQFEAKLQKAKGEVVQSRPLSPSKPLRKAPVGESVFETSNDRVNKDQNFSERGRSLSGSGGQYDAQSQAISATSDGRVRSAPGSVDLRLDLAGSDLAAVHKFGEARVSNSSAENFSRIHGIHRDSVEVIESNGGYFSPDFGSTSGEISLEDTVPNMIGLESPSLPPRAASVGLIMESASLAWSPICPPVSSPMHAVPALEDVGIQANYPSDDPKPLFRNSPPYGDTSSALLATFDDPAALVSIGASIADRDSVMFPYAAGGAVAGTVLSGGDRRLAQPSTLWQQIPDDSAHGSDAEVISLTERRDDQLPELPTPRFSDALAAPRTVPATNMTRFSDVKRKSNSIISELLEPNFNREWLSFCRRQTVARSYQIQDDLARCHMLRPLGEHLSFPSNRTPFSFEPSFSVGSYSCAFPDKPEQVQLHLSTPVGAPEVGPPCPSIEAAAEKPVAPPSAKRPTHFVALRVDQPRIVNYVYRFQKGILKRAPHLKPCAINPAKLHISLLILSLGENEVERARSVVEAAIADFRNQRKEAERKVDHVGGYNNQGELDGNREKGALTLDFTQVGMFGTRVLFATMPEAQQRELQSLHLLLVQRVQQVGLQVVGLEDEGPLGDGEAGDFKKLGESRKCNLVSDADQMTKLCSSPSGISAYPNSGSFSRSEAQPNAPPSLWNMISSHRSSITGEGRSRILRQTSQEGQQFSPTNAEPDAEIETIDHHILGSCIRQILQPASKGSSGHSDLQAASTTVSSGGTSACATGRSLWPTESQWDSSLNQGAMVLERLKEPTSTCLAHSAEPLQGERVQDSSSLSLHAQQTSLFADDGSCQAEKGQAMNMAMGTTLMEPSPELMTLYDRSELAGTAGTTFYYPHLTIMKTSQGLRRIKNRKKKKLLRILPEYFHEAAQELTSFGCQTCFTLDFLEMTMQDHDGYYHRLATFPLIVTE